MNPDNPPNNHIKSDEGYVSVRIELNAPPKAEAALFAIRVVSGIKWFSIAFTIICLVCLFLAFWVGLFACAFLFLFFMVSFGIIARISHSLVSKAKSTNQIEADK